MATITGRLTTIIDADNSGLLAKIKQSTDQLKKLANFKTSIGLDNKSLISKVNESAKSINKLGGKKVSIDANSQPLISKVTDSAKSINKLSGKKVSIDANNQSFVSKISDSKKSLSKLSSKKVSIDANNKPFINKISDSLKEVKKLSGKNIVLTATSKVNATIKKTVNSLKSLKGKSILLTAKSKVNATIKKTVNSLKSLKGKSILLTAKDNVKAKVNQIANRLKSLRGKTIPLNVKMGDSSSRIKKTTKDIQNLGKASKRTTTDVAKLGKAGKRTGSSLSGMIKGIGFAAIAAGITLLTKKILKLTIEAEQTQVAFQSLLGSDVGGSRLYNEIIKLASVTPFTSSKLNAAAKTMLAFGVDSKKIIPTLRMVGDVSAATGADIGNLALAFGQIKSQGKLMGQDLNQLINAGFNPLQVISEKTGRSMSDLKDDMSKGLITFDQVENAFKDATSEGGKFFKMMERQSGTIGGQLSTLKDNLDQIYINLGKKAAPALGEIVKKLNKAAEALAKVTAGEGTVGEKAAVGTAAAGGVGVAGIFAAILASKTLGFALKHLGTLVAEFGKILFSLSFNRASKMTLVLGTAMKSLHKAGIPLAINLKKLAARISMLGKRLTKLKWAKALGGIGPLFKTMSRVFTSGIKTLFFNLATPIVGAIAAIAVAVGVWIAKINSLNKAFNDIGAGTTTLIDSIKGGIANLFDVLKAAANIFIIPLKNVGKFLVMVAKDTKKAVGEFISSLIRPFKLVKDFGKSLLDLALRFKVVQTFIKSLKKSFNNGMNSIKNSVTNNLKPILNYVDGLTLGIAGKFLEWVKLINLDFLSNVLDEFLLNAEKFSVKVVDFFTFGKYSEGLEEMDEIFAEVGKVDPKTIAMSRRLRKVQAARAAKEAEEAAAEAAKVAAEAADKLAQASIEAFKEKAQKGFDNVNLEIDVASARESILKNKDEFMDALSGLGVGINEALAELGSDLDFDSIEDILAKAPKELIPKFAELIKKVIDIEKQKMSNAFGEISLDIDISEAKAGILRNKEAFAKVFENFAGKGIFAEIENIDELLEKLPKELLPNIEDLLGKLVDVEEMKISRIIAKVGNKKDVETDKLDILKNKIYYEPLLAEFGFASFEEAFLKIPEKLLPQFKSALEKLAPKFDQRLGQVRKNLDVFSAKKEIDKRLKEIKEGKFKNNLGIPNKEVHRILSKLVKSTPEENLPEVLNTINQFVPKLVPSQNEGKLAGAVMKGSVAAHSVLTARQEVKTEKEIEKNTALTVEFLKQINEGGIALKNIEVAR